MLEHGDHSPATPQVAPPADGQLPDAPESPRELALDVALLSAAGVSLVSCAQTFGLADPFAFLTANNMGPAAIRLRWLVAMVLGAVVPALFAIGLRLAKGRAGAAIIHYVARLIAPVALLGLLPVVFDYRLGHGQPMYYLVVLSLLALLLRPALRTSISATRLRWFPRAGAAAAGARKVSIPFVVVVLGALGYTIYFSYYTILQHRLILTTAFDLGIYDNLMYNALHGHAFHSPVLFGPGDRNYLAGHAELGMLLFVPLYAIAPGPETMLVIQAATLGLAAIPLYLFAAQSLPRSVALCVSFVYLMFPALHQPNFYDFHWLPLAVFFHFWAYYALASKRTGLFWAMFAVLLLIREDVSVGTAVLGLFLVLATERLRLGLAVMAVSAAWFVAIKFVMMPSFGTWWFDGMYKGLFADGKPGYGSVIQTLLSNPLYALSTTLTADKATYLLHMLAPLAFLPVRRPQLWLLAGPGMLFTLLTTQYWPTTSIRFQYTAHWIPYLFFAVVMSLGALRTHPRAFTTTPFLGAAPRPWRPPASTRLLAWTATLAICALGHSYAFGAVLQHEKAVGGFREVEFDITDAQIARYRALRGILALIPESASVASTEYMSPHVSTRKEAYVPRQDLGTPDYVLLSSREIHGDPKKWLLKLFREKSYALVSSAANEFYLFKRGKRDAATESALRTLHLNEKAPGKP